MFDSTDSWEETNWFAVQARPYHENLAAARVELAGIEVFLPRVRMERMICGVRRWITKALFPGYFFARFCPDPLLEAVRHAQGVVRVLGTRQFPVPLDGEIVRNIRERAHADGFIYLERNAFVQGDEVMIEQGPLAGWMGKVEREWDDGRRVLILLEAIQQARLVVEKRWLSAVGDRA